TTGQAHDLGAAVRRAAGKPIVTPRRPPARPFGTSPRLGLRAEQRPVSDPLSWCAINTHPSYIPFPVRADANGSAAGLSRQAGTTALREAVRPSIPAAAGAAGGCEG